MELKGFYQTNFVVVWGPQRLSIYETTVDIVFNFLFCYQGALYLLENYARHAWLVRKFFYFLLKILKWC